MLLAGGTCTQRPLCFPASCRPSQLVPADLRGESSRSACRLKDSLDASSDLPTYPVVIAPGHNRGSTERTALWEFKRPCCSNTPGVWSAACEVATEIETQTLRKQLGLGFPSFIPQYSWIFSYTEDTGDKIMSLFSPSQALRRHQPLRRTSRVTIHEDPPGSPPCLSSSWCPCQDTLPARPAFPGFLCTSHSPLRH